MYLGGILVFALGMVFTLLLQEMGALRKRNVIKDIMLQVAERDAEIKMLHSTLDMVEGQAQDGRSASRVSEANPQVCT